MNDKKSYIYSFLSSTLLCLLFVAFVNIFIDIHGLYFRGGSDTELFFNEYALALQKNNNGLVAHDQQRLVKRALANQTDSECYVIGSSHVMAVGKNQMPKTFAKCDSVINLGVSGASFEDFLIFLSLVVKKKHIKTVFINIDPWMLKQDMDKRYILLSTNYQSAKMMFNLSESLDDINEAREQVYKWIHILNFEYFLRNLYKVYLHKLNFSFLQNSILPIISDQSRLDNSVFFSDGRLGYSLNFLKKMPPSWQDIDDGSYKIKKPYYSEFIISIIKDIVHSYKNEIEFVFILTPYHPKVWLCQNQEVCNALESVELKIKEVAKELKINTVGSYRNMQLQHENFIDSMHLSESAFSQIESGDKE